MMKAHRQLVSLWVIQNISSAWGEMLPALHQGWWRTREQQWRGPQRTAQIIVNGTEILSKCLCHLVISPLPTVVLSCFRLDYDEECQRLKDGFKRSVGNSELWRTLVDFRSLVSKPEWQKSTYSAVSVIHVSCHDHITYSFTLWVMYIYLYILLFFASPWQPYCILYHVFYIQYGNLSSSCSICNTSFVGALTKLSKICCICGSRVCRGCSSKDLLVYIPDEEKGIKNPEPRLSVIKVVGVIFIKMTAHSQLQPPCMVIVLIISLSSSVLKESQTCLCT